MAGRRVTVEERAIAMKRRHMGDDDELKVIKPVPSAPIVRAVVFSQPNGAWGELSNFARIEPYIMYDGRTWTTSEHVYQARKFDWSTEAGRAYSEVIRRANTPYIAKLLASQRVSSRYDWMASLKEEIERGKAAGVAPWPDWEERRVNVMREVLILKFTSSPFSQNILRLTGRAPIVEHSTTDNFWADGGGAPGQGQNMLGKLLVEIRDTVFFKKSVA